MCSLVNFVSVSCFVCTGYNKKNSTFASYNWPVAERSANGRPRPVSQKIRESGVKNRPCLSLLESFRILETFEASLDDLADRTLIFCAKRAQSWIFCLLFVSRQKVSRGVRGGSPCSWKNVCLSDYQILLIHILLIYKRIWTCESWIKVNKRSGRKVCLFTFLLVLVSVGYSNIKLTTIRWVFVDCYRYCIFMVAFILILAMNIFLETERCYMKH